MVCNFLIRQKAGSFADNMRVGTNKKARNSIMEIVNYIVFFRLQLVRSYAEFCAVAAN